MPPIDSKADFDKLLDKQIHYFLHLKRLYRLQMEVLSRCEGRPIKNDLIYQQMLYASLDGLFVRLHNFGIEIHTFLVQLKQMYLDQVKRNKRRELEVNASTVLTDDFSKSGVDKSVAKIFTKNLQDRFDQTYDKLFPGVKERKEGRPNHADVEKIEAELKETFAPIKAHRDTLVAHWDEEIQPASLTDLKKAVDYIEYLLGAVLSISRLAMPNFELGGIAARVETTSEDIAELILGEFRVRRATPAEMPSIYKMGFDVWAEGSGEKDYLVRCAASPKYAKGIWYVLEDRKGQPISSLIVYPLKRIGTENSIGLGSIATTPELRKKGHARQLVHDTIRFFRDKENVRVTFLWADLNPEWYRRMGFIDLPEKLQTRAGSRAMVNCSKPQLDIILADPDFQMFGYF